MIKVNLSAFKKEIKGEEKLTNEEHQEILMYFIKQIIKSKTKIPVSFIISTVSNDVDNHETYFFKVKIIANRNLHAINALISTLLDVFSRHLNKEVLILSKKVRYKREFRKSNQRLKIEREDVEKFKDFLNTFDFQKSENSSFYIKRKYALDKKISNKEEIFSKNFDPIELYLLCCKLLNVKPSKEHVETDEPVNSSSEFFLLDQIN